MSEYKKIDKKEIWLILKQWQGGLFEVDSAHWTEEAARLAASKLLGAGNPSIHLYNTMLHGCMLDFK